MACLWKGDHHLWNANAASHLFSHRGLCRKRPFGGHLLGVNLVRRSAPVQNSGRRFELGTPQSIPALPSVYPLPSKSLNGPLAGAQGKSTQRAKTKSTPRA